jgi:hypothetical protein
MTDSMRTKIATAICTKLATITELKYICFDRVRMLASDFQDWEIPAVQLIDYGDDNEHSQRRALKRWNVSLEIVMGDKTTGIINQKNLWDLEQKIEETLFSQPNLVIPGVVHMILLGSTTDLHTLAPFYTARIDIQIEYFQPLVDVC